ncbi:hypothetical protein PMIN06_003625 [Paraphaeosphaeria minitans]
MTTKATDFEETCSHVLECVTTGKYLMALSSVTFKRSREISHHPFTEPTSIFVSRHFSHHANFQHLLRSSSTHNHMMSSLPTLSSLAHHTLTRLTSSLAWSFTMPLPHTSCAQILQNSSSRRSERMFNFLTSFWVPG